MPDRHFPRSLTGEFNLSKEDNAKMFGKKHAAESGKKKYLYMFEEGNKDMRELLGGKGANLAEMTNAGMPVPPGFT